MKKLTIPLIALVIGLIVGGSAIYLVGQKTGVTVQREVPVQVEQKYTELTERYKGTIGTTLSRCSTSDQIVYTVTGSSGYTGETVYFDEFGTDLGRTEFSDTDIDSAEPPVEINQDSCVKLRSTAPEIQ